MKLLGVSTAASVFSTTAVLKELALECKGYAKEITDIQAKVERSRRHPTRTDMMGQHIEKWLKRKVKVLQYLL